MLWIERRPGALWEVGRAVNPHALDGEPRHDWLFEGYELDDALEPRTPRSRTTCASRATTAARRSRCRPFKRSEDLNCLVGTLVLRTRADRTPLC